MGKNSGNILLIILAAVGILAASVGGYFWWTSKTIVSTTKQTSYPKPKETSPSADLTTNWKTYTNQKLGFSIKYPQGWREPILRVQSTHTELDFGPNEYPTLMMKVGINYNQTTGRSLSFSEIVNSRFRYPESISDYFLNGIKGKRIDGVMGASSKQVNIFVPMPKTTENILEIEYIIPFNLLEPSKLFDQILSTFRFD